MKPVRPLAAAVALALAAFATPSLADGPSDPNKAAASHRESIYHVIKWNWGRMAAMVKGEQTFDRADFAKRAARISFLSHQLDEAYPEGSGTDTEALPAIWENRADFDAKLEDFQREAKALRIASAGSEEAAMKAQFQKVAGTCKACHDDYRAD